MKRYTSPIAAMLLLAAVATAALAPPAGAEHERRWNRGRDGRRVEFVYGRTYFYRDVDTGRRDSHISNLRGGYGRHWRAARVVKIDIRTGRVLAHYVWNGDRDRWIDCDRHFRVAHNERRGSWDRDRSYGVSYWGN